VLLVFASLFAAAVAADPTVIQWKFSYTGHRVKAQGIVETAAAPSPMAATGSSR
jgi:hypothetical protein